MRCVDLDDFWRDKATSLTVIRDIGKAVGYWVSMTSTEGIIKQVHYGIDTSASQTDSSTETFGLDTSMSIGCTFDGGNAKSTISSKYSKTMTHDAKQVYTANFSVDVTKTCTVKKGTEGVGLYQWFVASTDADGKKTNVVRT